MPREEITSGHHDAGGIHRLEWNFRGAQHVHRWQALCSCERWQGVPTRRQKEAADQHRDHVQAVEKPKSKRGGGSFRAITPWHKLPEALR